MLVTLLIQFAFGFVMANDQPVQIVSVGCFHHDEVKIDPDLHWNALFYVPASDGEYEVKHVRVKLSKCHDGILDAENERTGVEVSIDTGVKYPVILIGGIKLKEKKIKTDPKTFKCLYPGETVIAGEDYHHLFRLHAYGNAIPVSNTNPEPRVDNYKLVLEKMRVLETDPYLSQVIIDNSTFSGDESRPSVVWAGDIDGDGNPDFLLNLSNHYNLSHLALYLSSKAEGNELVHLVAEWSTTGC